MKKFLSIVLSLALMLCILPMAAPEAKAAVAGDYIYTVADGKATITSYNKNSTAKQAAKSSIPPLDLVAKIPTTIKTIYSHLNNLCFISLWKKNIGTSALAMTFDAP